MNTGERRAAVAAAATEGRKDNSISSIAWKVSALFAAVLILGLMAAWGVEHYQRVEAESKVPSTEAMSQHSSSVPTAGIDKCPVSTTLSKDSLEVRIPRQWFIENNGGSLAGLGKGCSWDYEWVQYTGKTDATRMEIPHPKNTELRPDGVSFSEGHFVPSEELWFKDNPQDWVVIRFARTDVHS